MVAAPLAYRFTAGLIPVRKKGKLPWEIESEEYALEYGTDLLEVHRDAIVPGERILIVDDVLATGGTARATARLTERCGGKVAGIATIMELSFLNGRSKLTDYEILSLISY
jgi:adenine phosphoribosyltransferase